MRLISKLGVCFLGLILSVAASAHVYTIGVLESKGAGGYDKPAVKKMWDQVVLVSLNDNHGDDEFEAQYYSDVDQLKKALQLKKVDYAYAQSPAMIKSILVANPNAKVVSTLLTENPQTKELSESYAIYLITAKDGLNITNTKGLRNKLAKKRVAITFENFHAAELIKKALSNDEVMWMEAKSFVESVQLVELGKADATFATIRAGYFSQKDFEKLTTVPAILHPNGALLAAESVSASDSAKLAKVLQALPASSFSDYFIRGFGKAYSADEYMRTLSMPKFD